MYLVMMLILSLNLYASGIDVSFLEGAEIVIDPYGYIDYEEINAYDICLDDIDCEINDDTELTLTVGELYNIIYQNN